MTQPARMLAAMLLALAAASAGGRTEAERIEYLASIRTYGPVSESLDDLWSGKPGINCCLKLKGRVRDAFIDEHDHRYAFLVIESKGDFFYVAVRDREMSATALRSLVGAVVSVTGIRDPGSFWNPRQMIGPHLNVLGEDDISVVVPAPADPFSAPAITPIYGPRPKDVLSHGRYLASGRVLAAWGDRQFLMETKDNGMIVRVTLAQGPVPRAGECIDAVGFPETDLYHINLSQAIWRNAPRFDFPSVPEREVSSSDIFSANDAHRRAATDFHGRTVRLSGTVRSPPGADGRMFFSDGEDLVAVDLSSTLGNGGMAGELEIGALVEVTGVCVLEIDNWRPGAAFPRVGGYFVVPRNADDVVILRSPPWWTPGRLIGVIAIMLIALTGVLLWNVSLRAMAVLRGREIFREQLRHAKSALKVEERTRLAVELHDLLSQSLTGISYALGAASRRLGTDPAAARERLDVAAKSLSSTREELRNCLWDLRSGVLDESDFAEAIRKTLAPHLGETSLSVRFGVPRSSLADSTAHMILGIIRELATNSVRHGAATQIRVAGSVENGEVAFSLADDGCGFDPLLAPGFEQGHFGLQGIRERVAAMNGRVIIDSAPGKGTRVEVRLAYRDGAVEEEK